MRATIRLVPLACALLSGCSALPSLRLPWLSTGPASTSASATTEAPTAAANAAKPQESVASLPRPASAWWTEFGSDELNRLQELALANNRDHRIAIARVAQANAQARLTGAARSPNVDLTGGVSHSGPEAGRGRVDSGETWSGRALLEVGVRASYEVDLWGRLGYAAESALAQAAASQHAREAVALTLTSDVALAYFEYQTFAARAKTLELGVQSRQRSLAGVRRRAELGDATSGESERQAFELARAEEAFALHARRRDMAFNRLAQLLGMSGSDLKLASVDPATLVLPSINHGLPSELLCRRPDIRRAHAQLEAARLDIQSARANLMPAFSLTAESGLAARTLAELVTGRALYYLLSSALTQTLFDGGRKSAQLEITRARQQEALELYSGTLISALRDVEDALANRHFSGLQHQAYERALESSAQQLAARRRALDAGNVDILSFYLAEQRLLDSQDALQSAHFERVRAAVDLYKAIGGGSRVHGTDPCVRTLSAQAPPASPRSSTAATRASGADAAIELLTSRANAETPSTQTQDKALTEPPVVATPVGPATISLPTPPLMAVPSAVPSTRMAMATRELSVAVDDGGATDREAIRLALHRWTRAWSSKDMRLYTEAYVPDFKGSLKTRQDWLQQRTARIALLRDLQVRISEEFIQVDGDKAWVQFRQHYRSERLTQTENRFLHLQRIDGRWLIALESGR